MSTKNWIKTLPTTLDHDLSNCMQKNETKSVKIFNIYSGKINKMVFLKTCKLGLTFLKNSINFLKAGCGDSSASTTSNR
jgi:hypothetical protein